LLRPSMEQDLFYSERPKESDHFIGPCFYSAEAANPQILSLHTKCSLHNIVLTSGCSCQERPRLLLARRGGWHNRIVPYVIVEDTEHNVHQHNQVEVRALQHRLEGCSTECCESGNWRRFVILHAKQLKQLIDSQLENITCNRKEHEIVIDIPVTLRLVALCLGEF
jgi:hypothetical protein